MANHGTTVLLLIASLVVVLAVSSTDARLTAVRHNARVVTVPRKGLGGYYALEKEKAAPPVPELTCKKVHGVRAAETCSSVAEGSGLTQDGFLSFNPNINCDQMFVGQWVCLRATAA